MKTPIRYAGGKSKAYKTITPFIPTDVKRVVSPFVGGGSLEVKWATENGIDVIGFDIFDILEETVAPIDISFCVMSFLE